jgi:glycosyltransferase involved in cell wall biosynthesis
MKVLIIIPVYNEEAAITSVLQHLKVHCPDCDLLVVNDASTDHSALRAAGTGLATVLQLPYNLGIGGCVQTGFRYAEAHGYDMAVQVDGDGQHNPEDVARLLEVLQRGEADVAIGSRFNLRDGSGFRSTGMRRLGIRVLGLASLILTGQRITDHTSGFRAFNRKAFTLLAHNYSGDYPEPEAIVLLCRQGFRMTEIFTQMFERQGGVSSIPLHKGPYYMTKVLLSMCMAALRRSHL